MRSRNRFVTGAVAVALAASGAILAVGGSAEAAGAEPTGGCWVYGFNPGDPLESTTPSYSISSGYAPWTDAALAPAGIADYEITSSGGTLVGTTRNFSLTFNKGPKSAAPAVGTAYYYFSVNGANLPAPVSIPMNIAANDVQAGATVSGSYAITAGGTNTIKLRKVIYDATASGVRVGCNGQTAAVSGGVNPATTPVDTNITGSFTAFAVASASITGVSNQTVLTHARAGDVISFSGSDFSAAGTGTAQLCDSTGANCNVPSATTFTVAANGTGTGTITVPASFTGAKTLRLENNGEVGLKAITLLAGPTIAVNLSAGPVGTTVSVTGANWDPNSVVTVGGYKAGPPFPPPASSDPTITVTANASGAITGTFTVNDPLTKYVGGTEMHNGAAIFATSNFAASADSCVAKAGAATTGSCSVLNTVKLTVTAGNLTMAKVAGDVTLTAVQLNGAAQASTGSLQDVTVKDYRGGALGWSLTGKFSGLTGPAAIAPNKLTWTPSCTAAANNDDTVVTGASGAFADATTALPLCSVATTGLGADATSGGDTAADAGLSLALGANQAAGAYTGTLTLTLS